MCESKSAAARSTQDCHPDSAQRRPRTLASGLPAIVEGAAGHPEAFAQCPGDGRICLTNNAAERALRGIAVGRKAWLFAGSDRGGQRSAATYSLMVTARLSKIDPQAWLADLPGRIGDHPASRLDQLLPSNWRTFDAAAA